jgi:hypothetical protein
VSRAVLRIALIASLASGCALSHDFSIFDVSDGGRADAGRRDAGQRDGGDEDEDAGTEDAGMQPLSCAGTFAPARVILDDTGLFQSPATTADELELFYGASLSQGAPQELRVSRRSSRGVNFPAGARVEEVEAYCTVMFPTATSRTVDVTRDGLTLYVSCHDSSAAPEVPLLEFTRADRSSPWTFARNAGSAYCCASVSPSGLELYSSDPNGFTVFATRATPSDVFGPNAPAPGLETTMARSPDLAPDEQSLFATSIGVTGILEFTRTDTGFSPTATTHSVLVATAFGGADMSADCRTIYFAAAVNDAAGLYTQHVYVSQR